MSLIKKRGPSSRKFRVLNRISENIKFGIEDRIQSGISKYDPFGEDSVRDIAVRQIQDYYDSESFDGFVFIRDDAIEFQTLDNKIPRDSAIVLLDTLTSLGDRKYVLILLFPILITRASSPTLYLVSLITQGTQGLTVKLRTQALSNLLSKFLCTNIHAT